MSERDNNSPRIRAFDIGEGAFVDADDLERHKRLGIDLLGIGTFLSKVYADAEQFDNSAIGVYGPNSPHTDLDVMGYVNKPCSAVANGDTGLLCF